MTHEYIITHTAAEIAAAHGAEDIKREIGSWIGLELDDIVEMIGSGDTSDWADLRPEDLETACRRTVEGMQDSDIVAEALAMDFILYTAWKLRAGAND